MINETLVFLKNSLNTHLNLGGDPRHPQEDQVVFMAGQNTDALSFKLGAVTLLLLNVEQDNVLHAPNIYRRTLPDGTIQNINPDIRVNLYVLFIANYQQYEDSLRMLSSIIQYFQNHRIFTALDAPDLDESIEQLIIELVTLSFSEQNEVWGALRSHYHPSILYKVKTLVYEGESAMATPEMGEKDVRLSQ